MFISDVSYVRALSVCVFSFVPGLRIRIANLVFKLLSCLLYITRVATDIDPTYTTW